MDASIKDLAFEVLDIESECISLLKDHFDEDEYEKAADLIINAERVASCGCGHSGIMCRHFAHLMCCIDRPAAFISPSEALHGGSGFLQKGDVCLFVSRGGMTDELFEVMDICRKKGVKTIVVTENTKTGLAENADAVLKMHVTRETDPYDAQGTTSSVVSAVIFHVLQRIIMEKTGFTAEDFALIHPGGAVGKRLNG